MAYRLIVFLGLLVFFTGCKRPCRDVVTYRRIYTEIPDYFYNVGSYWVYRDSASGVTDSQFVYKFNQRTHYRDPKDTPERFYSQLSPGGVLSTDYCGPYFLDDIKMNIASYQNGNVYDTFTFHGVGSESNTAAINIWNHESYNSSTSVTGIFLNPYKVGFLDCCFTLTRDGGSYDTTGEWYRGKLASVRSGGYTFNNVAIWTVQIGDGTSRYFRYPTDIYITKENGIIKIIQHRLSGDIVWHLINYRIRK